MAPSAEGLNRSKSDVAERELSARDSGLDRLVHEPFVLSRGPVSRNNDSAGPLGADSARAQQDYTQRALDILISSVMLLILFPVFAIIVIAIRFDTRGALLFVQQRVGKNGKIFSLYKFRSMVVDAEKHRAHLEIANERSGPVFKMRRDPRITRVGRILRKLSLDELPQLVNVLIGDMSLVGPRPALPSEVALYSEHARQRLLVMPGLTGLWQVSGRANLSFEESIALDLRHVEQQTLGLYLGVLLRTIPAVLIGQGAY